MKDPDELDLSPSVLEALKQAGPSQPISASGLARLVFKLHPEYAERRAGSLVLQEGATKRNAEEWIEEVQTLFNEKLLATLSKSEPPILHGRLLIIGLSLLESDLRGQLEKAGTFAVLTKEIREPWLEVLSERGREYNESWEGTKKAREELDTVANWPDDPLLDPDQDLLGRAAFARFLARRIAAIPRESGAYAIHVYGPWGAGKSTLLNFLSKELQGGKHWLMVEFNAWRNQQIQPPWWSLLERIFTETQHKLSGWARFQEYWWRFNTGRLEYLVGIVALAWILALVVFPLLRFHTNETAPLSSFRVNAENLSKLLALVTTIWGGILAAQRSLLLGGAQAAQKYTQLTHDPTGEIKRRFNRLIQRLLPQRVVIIIDDLDRCQSRYAVDLLEGIQTLFREAPVVFVIAADRHWLNACYEEVYEKLEPRIHEPGKPLGTLFLEKAFRFSTPMPGIPEGLKKSYWEHLLQLQAAEQSGDMTTARQRAHHDLAEAQSEGAVRALVDASSHRPFFEQRAIREEAVVRLAAPDVLARLEHTLKPYSALLEPNPRGMKLLVNAYSANRALAILSEVNVELHQLALWTILSSRWPELADHLAEHPEMLETNADASTDLPENLKPLWKDRSVAQVVKGDSMRAPLSAETLKQCAQMRS
jgi:Cdc6-like AAA superfamily ATPase